MEFVGLGTAPAVSAANEARLYYDNTAATLKVSENGLAYRTLGGHGIRLFAKVTVALGSTGDTTLYTPPAAEDFMPSHVVFVAESGVPTTVASVSTGTNGTFDNVSAAQPLTGLLAAGPPKDLYDLKAGPKAIVVPSGTAFKVRVTVAANAAQSVTAYVFGSNYQDVVE